MEKSELTEQPSEFKAAQDHLVGGVNSPVRAFHAVGGEPPFIAKAKGATLTDTKGKTYIDFVGSWGPMILGHNHPSVMGAVKAQLSQGTSFGAPTLGEVELAQLVKKAFPSIDLLRMTSSGTEATMSALRVARAFTKRERIIKFEGTYHGHFDGLLVAAGSGATTFGVPSSAGVPSTLARTTWVLPFNDEAALESTFRTQGINIAAVIVEPVCGNMGVVLPRPGFLESLRKLCTQHGALLIFDEVMTGFRLAWGGAQEIYKIRPDLTCLGKIMGGGFPVGAFGGRADIMKLVAPLGPVYQAGTLSGNPVAVAAGLATLRELENKKPYKELEAATEDLSQFLTVEAQKKKVPLQVSRSGSMWTAFFTENPVFNYFTATQSDTKAYARFFHACLEEGVYLPPSQFEAAFLSVAHSPALIKRAKRVFSRALGFLS